MNFWSGMPILLVACGYLLGCGQKGPLMLPDAPKHKRSVPAIPTLNKPKTGNDAPAAPSTPVTTAPDPTPNPQ